MLTTVFQKIAFIFVISTLLLVVKPQHVASLNFINKPIDASSTSEEGSKSSVSFIEKHWSTKDGLPINSLANMELSRNGLVWIATYDGLVRFDGIQFTNYSSNEYEEIVHNRFFNVLEGLNENIYFHSEDGSGYELNPRLNTIKRLKNDKGEPIYVNHISKSKSGTLLFSTEEGLFRLGENHQLTQVLPNLIKSVVYIAFEDQFGRLWFANQLNQLFYAHGTQVKLLSQSKLNSFRYFTIEENDSFSLLGWMNQIIWIDKQNIIVYEIPQFSFDENIQRLILHSNGSTLFVSSTQGKTYETKANEPKLLKPTKITGFASFKRHATRMQPELGYLIATSDGLYNENQDRIYSSSISTINDFIIDNEKNIWIAKSGDGVYQLKPNPFTTYTFGNQSLANNIFALIAHQNRAYVGSFGKGLFKLDLQTGISKPFPLHDGIQDAYIHMIQRSLNGSLYVGAISRFIYELTPNEQVIRHELPLVKNQTVNAFHEDSKGNIWIGTTEALYFKKPEVTSFKDAEIRNFSTNAYVKFIWESPEKTIWLGTHGKGVIVIKDDEPQPGFLQNDYSNAIIRYITLDSKLNKPEHYAVWITTEGQGILQVEVKNEQKTVTSIRKKQGLHDDTIHNMVFDQEHHLWASTNRGLIKIESSVLEDYLASKIERITYELYTEDNGLPNNEFNGGGNRSVHALNAHTFLFANQRGVVRVNTETLHPNTYVPDPIINYVKISGEMVNPIEPGRWKLRKDQRAFEIGFSSSSLQSPSQNQFAYRLLPEQTNWQYLKGKQTLQFTNLKSGEYKFELKASNNNGLFNPQPAVISFSVEPYWFETVWFYVIVFITLLISSYVLYRFRVNQLQLRSTRLEALVEERTDELLNERNISIQQKKDLLDVLESRKDLLSQLSYELKNPMSMIQTPLMLLRENSYGTLPQEANRVIQEVLKQSEMLDSYINKFIDIAKIHDGKFQVFRENIPLASFINLIHERIFAENPSFLMYFKLASNEIPACNLFIDSLQLSLAIYQLLTFVQDSLSQQAQFSFKLDKKGTDLLYQVIVDKVQKQDLATLQVELQQAKHHPIKKGNSTKTLFLRYIFELFQANELLVKWDFSSSNSFSFILSLPCSELQTLSPDFEEANEHTLNGKSIQDTEFIKELSDSEPVKPTALIVDDFQPFRLLVAEALKHDFDVMLAETGVQALQLIQQKQPDIIISDLRMPEMSGYEFIKKVRENIIYSGVPIILLSAVTDEVDQVKALNAGADIYMSKPFQPTVFIAQVKSLMAFRKRLRTSSTNDEPVHQLDYLQIKDDSDRQFVESMISEIQHNLSDPDFNVESLAQRLNIDRSALFRKLKKVIDKSPSVLIQELRILKAMEMLKEGKGNVSEVAYACGYNSLSYFSQAFKAHTGKSPSDWLLELRV